MFRFLQTITFTVRVALYSDKVLISQRDAYAAQPNPSQTYQDNLAILQTEYNKRFGDPGKQATYVAQKVAALTDKAIIGQLAAQQASKTPDAILVAALTAEQAKRPTIAVQADTDPKDDTPVDPGKGG